MVTFFIANKKINFQIVNCDKLNMHVSVISHIAKGYTNVKI